MRRRDREITDKNKIADILMRSQAMSLAFAGEPYVIPMNYGYEERDGRFTLSLHGAAEGEKIRRAQADPRAAFTAYVNNRVYGTEGAGCSGTSSFDSVCGGGRLRFLEGEEKVRGLRMLMAHYASGRTFDFPEEMLRVTCVLALDAEQITGKHHD